MKKILPIIASLMLLTDPVAAQENTGTTTGESNLVAPLRKGQVAPFSGVLFSQRAAATIVTDVRAAEERIRIEIAAAVALANARKQFELEEERSKCKSDAAVAAADIEEKRKKIKLLESELTATAEAAPSRSLWMGIGAAGGIVLTIVTVFAVNQVSK